MTKEEVIAAMLKCAAMLARVPSREELMKLGGVRRVDLRKHFGTFERLRRECKLEREPRKKKLDMERLFHDWGRVAREVKRLPTMEDYARLGEYSTRPYVERFGRWMNVPAGMKRYAEEHGFVEDWLDVLVQVKHSSEPRLAGPMTFAVNTHAPYRATVLTEFPYFAGPWYLPQRTRMECSSCLGPSPTNWGFLFCGCNRSFPTLKPCEWWEKKNCSG